MAVEGMKVLCRKCSNQVLSGDLKRDDDTYVCRACYEKAHFFDVKDVKEQFNLREDPENNAKNLNLERHSLRCNNCGYKFATQDYDPERLCPYCGEVGQVKIDR